MQWARLDRDEDQGRTAQRIGAPRLPRGDEVMPCAEAGFEHDETFAALPALRQTAAFDEGIARLGHCALRKTHGEKSTPPTGMHARLANH